MTTKPTDQLKALRAAKAAAQTLVETERTLRSQHTALLAEHMAIEAAPRALEELLADKDVRAALSEEEIREKFDLGYHTKHVDTIFRRVFGEA